MLLARVKGSHREGSRLRLMVDTTGAFTRELIGLCSSPREAAAVVKALYWNLSIMLLSYETIWKLVFLKAVGVGGELLESARKSS
ncbi:MAG: hypothetical protein ABWK01_06620 [Infirmifilum sp.]